jgi:hypothetical protein
VDDLGYDGTITTEPVGWQHGTDGGGGGGIGSGGYLDEQFPIVFTEPEHGTAKNTHDKNCNMKPDVREYSKIMIKVVRYSCCLLL